MWTQANPLSADFWEIILSDTFSFLDNSLLTSLPGVIPELVLHNTIFNVLGARFVSSNKYLKNFVLGDGNVASCLLNWTSD